MELRGHEETILFPSKRRDPGTFENQLLKSWFLSEHKPQYLAIVKKILTYQVYL